MLLLQVTPKPAGCAGESTCRQCCGVASCSSFAVIPSSQECCVPAPFGFFYIYWDQSVDDLYSWVHNVQKLAQTGMRLLGNGSLRHLIKLSETFCMCLVD